MVCVACRAKESWGLVTNILGDRAPVGGVPKGTLSTIGKWSEL